VTRVSEPPIYRDGGPHSYVADLAAYANGDTQAADRLHRHARGRALDATGGTRRAAAALRTLAHRTSRDESQREFRTMTSAAGSGGSFVTPEYITSHWADFRSWPATFADAAEQLDAPDFGLKVEVPYVSGGPITVSGTTSEGTAISETTLTGGYRTATLKAFSGSVRISNALLDRSGPTAFDMVAYTQAREALTAAIDTAVLKAAVTAATTNLTRATWTNMGSFYSDVMKAGASLETGSGLALPPTHAVLPPELAQWLQAVVDSEARPVWSPSGDAMPSVEQDGFTGYRVGSTAVYVDQNLAGLAATTHFKWLVSSPARSILVVRSEPVWQVIPETLAETLSVILRLYAYAGVVILRPGGSATVTGAAYPTSPTWA
jgi:HK97 family phage major capsid protein